MHRLALTLLSIGMAATLVDAASPIPVQRIRRELRSAVAAKSRAVAVRHLDRALAQLPRRRGEGTLAQRLRRTLEDARHSSTVTERRTLIHHAQAQLRSLETVVSLPGADPRAQESATRKLAEVLSRREFQHSDFQERVMEWVARQAMRFARWLSRHFRFRLGEGAWGVVTVIAYAVGFVAILLAALLLANTLSSLVSRWRGDAGPEGAARSRADEDSPHSRRRRLLDAVARYVAEGDYRQALRCLYQALLLTLHLRHVLDYDPHRTNREYLSQLHGMNAPALATVFDQATGLFERKWYGCQRADKDDVQSMSKLLEAAEEAAREWEPPDTSQPGLAAA